MARIFEDKYGKPASSEESKAAAQKVRPFTNELVRWTGPVLEIQLMKYSGRSTETDSSVAHCRLHSESAKFKKIIDKSLKKRAKVL